MSRVLSWTIIYLRMPLPAPSSAQPERGAGHTIALLFAFAPEGACQAAVLPRRWWSLAPPFQLFSHLEEAAGVFFSAALSVGSPRLAVSQLPALWSPDFPHDPKGSRDCLAHFAGEIVACRKLQVPELPPLPRSPHQRNLAGRAASSAEQRDHQELPCCIHTGRACRRKGFCRLYKNIFQILGKR
jgi:hypothetical protein